MDKALFWKLIAFARSQVDTYDVAALLVDRLALMEVSDILRWKQIFQEYQKLSYKKKLWAAAYVMNGGCGDDGFSDFRSWLIAQGKDTFLDALADPDGLVSVDVEMDEACYEEMLSVGSHAYFKKMGMALSEITHLDYERIEAACMEQPLSESEKENLAADIHYAEDIDMDWNESDLENVLPKLSVKYSGSKIY